MSIDNNIDTKFIKIPIDRIQPNSYNNNVFDKKTFEKLKQNIKRDGFNMPIIVKEIDIDKYEIIDGEHRYRAMKELGETYITCVVKKKDEITDIEQKRGTLSYNKLRGKEDHYKTALLVKDMIESDGDNGINAILDAGFTETEIKTLTQAIEGEDDFLSSMLSKEFKKITPKKDTPKSEIKKQLKKQKHYKLDKHIISFSNPRKINIRHKLINPEEQIDLLIINIPINDLKINENIFLWLKPLFDRAYELLNNKSLFILRAPYKINKNKHSISDYMGDTIKYLTSNIGLYLVSSIIEIDGKSEKEGILNYHTPVYLFSFSSNFKVKDMEYQNVEEVRNITDTSNEFIDIYTNNSIIENTLIHNLIKHFSFSKGKVVEFFIKQDTFSSCDKLNKHYIGVDNHPYKVEEIISNWEISNKKKRKPLEVKS